MTVGVYIPMLKNARHLLDVAAAYAAERKVSDETMLGLRLAPDMFPLVRQVQIISDGAKGNAARFAGIEAPKMEDSEKTIAALQQRLDATIAFLETLKPEQFAGAADVHITLPYFPGKHFVGSEYLTAYALPNFYFHMTTLYGILRSNGVTIGKTDYLGALPLHEGA